MGLGTAVGEDATGIPAYVRAVLQPSLGSLSEYTFVLADVRGRDPRHQRDLEHGDAGDLHAARA